MRIAFRLTALTAVAITTLGLTAARLPATGGTRLWLDRFNGVHLGAIGLAEAVSPGGSTVYVAGVSDARNQTNWLATIAAYNTATGAIRWAAILPAAGSRGSQFNAVKVSPDGSTVYVAGEDWPQTASSYQYLTEAFSAATGATRWTDGSGTSGQINSLALSPDGSTVFVSGSAFTTGGPVTLAYSAATGATLWTTADGVGSTGIAVAVSPDGSAVFTTGWTVQSGTNEFGTAAYNAATGATLWKAAGPAGVRPAAIAVSPDGSTVFRTGSGATGSGSATVAYAASSGKRLWAAYSDVTPEAMAVDPDGSKVFITGTNSTARSIKGFATVGVSAATGSRLWEAQYPGVTPPVGGTAYSIAVSPDGSRVFITGSTPGPKRGPYGYGTLAYNATSGAQLWTALQHSSYTGFAEAVVVSPDGTKVFVTGYLAGVPPPLDPIMNTVAYSS